MEEINENLKEDLYDLLDLMEHIEQVINKEFGEDLGYGHKFGYIQKELGMQIEWLEEMLED